MMRTGHGITPSGIGRRLLAAAGVALTLASPAAAQLRGALGSEGPQPALFAEPAYRVRAPEGTPPAGEQPGEIRRMIQSFGAWTLICDENLRRRQRVCNASQSIVDENGELAFSWSLAATRDGAPVFLVRAPVTGWPARTVALSFGNGEAEETVIRLNSCNARLCVGFMPVSPELNRRIAEKTAVRVRYRTSEAAVPVSIATSLAGLGSAIASIR